jgi:hypothetical protein
MVGKYELRNRRTPVDGERALSQVDEHHLDFVAPVVIDHTRRVEYRDAVPKGEACAGTNQANRALR